MPTIVNLIVGQLDVILEHGVPVEKMVHRVGLARPVLSRRDTTHHFCSLIFSGRVPVCAAINFLRSPTVSSSLQSDESGGDEVTTK